MRDVYHYRGSNAKELCGGYASVVKEEFYDGDLDTEPHDAMNVRMEKALADPISLLRITSNVGISFRRNWKHIRVNKVGVRVIWFIRAGSLKLTKSQGPCNVSANECIIMDSSQPFFAQTMLDPTGKFEAIQAIVPSSMFFSHLPIADGYDQPFAVDAEGSHIIEKLLDLFFGEDDYICPRMAEPLAVAFLSAIADKLDEIVAPASTCRQKLADRRLADIEACITRNLTNPDLTYDDVAVRCGISPRYLCYVLKANSTSFSHLLWSKRLPLARDWLGKQEMKEYPIQEIAYRAGFKSAAHFSRMFRAGFGISPKEYRAAALLAASNAMAQCVAPIPMQADCTLYRQPGGVDFAMELQGEAA